MMVGDEAGLGDPVEDAVSLAAVADLCKAGSLGGDAASKETAACSSHAPDHRRKLLLKALICVGLGADRFNDVSDASSLRAVAELTKVGGFLGAISLEPCSEALTCYRECIEHVYSRQEFRSVLTGCILAASSGAFGFDLPQELLRPSGRLSVGDAFVWPIMSVLWAFDIDAVAVGEDD